MHWQAGQGPSRVRASRRTVCRPTCGTIWLKDSHDCYANIKVRYLRQRMEGFDELAILATNLKGHLDEAAKLEARARAIRPKHAK